ncbi:Cytosine/adenosine deaminase [Mucilaginibacter pineti]|uniref:Cytosine/adenosine deaminase n=1 Tax=Mucilaginibacter pineti TaxID=1391627 RepID=A0A1G6TAI3_9SPHI|nr:amidohydrolase family protein [Mucilaginibacter pineti]SDD25335.1 Cytosine/adenosine deaminase [Mucilaginibacter pineti]
MVINKVRLADSGQVISIVISDGVIKQVDHAAIGSFTGDLQLFLDDAIVFPGLINSHDHLDFNLFPQLGHRIYNNYTEWGAYIHKEFKDEIAGVLKVPKHLRILWGVYKNLLCGVTTVVNHGERITLPNPLIDVFEQTQDLHSVAFEKGWKFKLNNPIRRKLPVVVHTGEGTDKQSNKEIDALISWNKLGRDLVGIHAVAITKEQAPYFKAIVWCPESNYFLLNKTAPVRQIKPFTDIIFGTDSTLTSNWNIWDHIRLAHKTGLLADENLYESLNKTPSKIWKINTGKIAAGKNADLVIAKGQSSGFDTFFTLNPADLLLVLHHGQVRLMAQELLPQLAHQLKGKGFSLIKIDNAYKYVEGNLMELTADIHTYLPGFVFPFEVIDYQIL